MSATPVSQTSSLPRAAVALRVRERWMLLALLALAIVRALSGAAMDGIATQVAPFGALFIAVAFALPAFGDDGTRSASDRRVRASAMAVLTALWLPSASPWPRYAIAVAACLGIARAFDAKIGRCPFHPAMVGCAVALVLAPTANAASPATAAAPWFAGTCCILGIGLALGRCIRWQPSLAFGAGGLAMFGACLIPGSPWSRESLPAVLPTLALTACFVVPDPSSACQSPRARLAQASLTGALCVLCMLALPDATRAFIGMAGAVLLMNAAAPWLDRAFGSTRARRTAGTT